MLIPISACSFHFSWWCCTSFVGSDVSCSGWFSMGSSSLTTWISQPSSSFTTIWGNNAPENNQFSSATVSGDEDLAKEPIITNSNLRVFTFAQLRAATYNFRSDMVVGKGGFGKVYKGWIKEKLPPRGIKKTAVGVKKLDSSSSMQGFQEWKVCVLKCYVQCLLQFLLTFILMI